MCDATYGSERQGFNLPFQGCIEFQPHLMNEVPDVQITVATKRPKGEKGYVRNRHTPTNADVEKLLASM